MNNLIIVDKETITSMEVAQMIGKEHKNIIRDIRRYINQINKINESKNMNQLKIEPVDFFIDTTYTDSKGENRPCYNITRKGCEFISNKLTGVKGTEFTARYVNRFHELEAGNSINTLITAIDSLSNTVLEIQKITNERMDRIENAIEFTTNKKKSLSEKKYSRWKANMFNKLKILTEYANNNSDQILTLSDTLHITINEMQDTYDIELSDYTKDYMLEHSLDTKPYDLDVIDYYKDIKNMYNLTVNSILEKLNINTDIFIKKNIFDELTKNIQKQYLR